MQEELWRVRKADGHTEPFSLTKVARGIRAAMQAAKSEPSATKAQALAERVNVILHDTFAGRMPTTADIADAVEDVLASSKLQAVATAFVLYRHQRKADRGKGHAHRKHDLALSVNAIKVLERRYLRRDDHGLLAETPTGLFRRVAVAVAQAEDAYHTPAAEKAAFAERAFRAMERLEFLPNSPTLMNAGQPHGQLAACFVLPVEDNLESIFDAIKHTAKIHQSGGGTGFNFSALRPAGDRVASTGGKASGALSFIGLFNHTTEVIKQGGRRRGANMGILNADHPDIEAFIALKATPGSLANFNLSVAASDHFMKAAGLGQSIALRNPRTGAITRRTNAKTLFRDIAQNAWAGGDPGLIFLDEINRKNPTAHRGKITTTNPCGEQPLHANESCTLGSINLAALVANGSVDWVRLAELIQLGVRFLDNVLDVNAYPLPEVAEVTRAHRRIGLGVMGFAEALIAQGIPYDTPKALRFAEQLAAFFQKEAHASSAALAKTRGTFPTYAGSSWEKMGKPMRNATVTTIAPTGTISILAGCSSGIEPLFAVSFVRNVMEGTRLLEVNSLFERITRERGLYSPELLFQTAEQGTLQHTKLPADLKHLFRTALEIKPEWHIKMQAAFQKHTDNAVSKTINLPPTATVADVERAFRLAWKLKCKGITVYRYGSRPEQVLTIEAIPSGPQKEVARQMMVDAEYSGGCPTPNCNY